MAAFGLALLRSLWVTQMAQITRIMLALRQETPAVCPGKFKKIEIHKKLLLYI
jgi:hypothetical protein